MEENGRKSTIYLANKSQNMKKILTLAATLLLTLNMWAADITRQEAQDIAARFIRKVPTLSAQRRAKAQEGMPTLAYTLTSGLHANLYVFNLPGGEGFVIVSGESSAPSAILGWSDSGSFSYADAPDGMKALLSAYSEGIDFLRKSAPNHSLPSILAEGGDDISFEPVIEPLLTTQWSQNDPFNKFCPDRAPAGCLPVAIAQIMHFWKYPEKIVKTVDNPAFYGGTYDWQNMLDTYADRSSTLTQQDAVGHLLYDIGLAFGTNYSSSTSGSSTYVTTKPWVDYFGYSNKITIIRADNTEALTLPIKEELGKKRPVLYVGGDAIVHAMVIDGYTLDNHFHFNYGWGGPYDGYYLLSTNRFCNNSTLLTNIYPADTQTAVIDEMEYDLTTSGEAHLVKCNKASSYDTDIVVPDVVKYDGKDYRVTQVLKNAFPANNFYNSLTLGNNVENLEARAAFLCKFTTVVLSDKLQSVPDEAFRLSGIRNLTIGTATSHIGKYAFQDCVLSSVTCRSKAFTADDGAFTMTSPDCGEWLNSITSLGRKAFAGATFKDTPSFDTLEEVGDSAFASINVTRIMLPATLRKIAPTAFDLSSVTFFHLDPANPYYSSGHTWPDGDSNQLYNKAQTRLILVTSYNGLKNGDSDLPFPSTLVRMEPGSVASIPGQGFTIPGSVIQMEGAFNRCTSLDNLTCLQEVPPVVSDATFHDRLLKRPLYVPAGCIEAYRNAPGWRRFENISETWQAAEPAPVVPSEQYMTVHTSGTKGTDINLPTASIARMHLDATDAKANMVIESNGSTPISCPVVNIDSITWQKGFLYDNAETFLVNDTIHTAYGMDCTVRLSETVVDTDTPLTIRSAMLNPSMADGAIHGMAVDITLADGIHDLSGTAEITIPIKCGADEVAVAAWYNASTGHWERIAHHYDAAKQAIVISTNHLSTFGAFTIAAENTRSAHLISEYLLYSPESDFGSLILKMKRLVEADDVVEATFKSTVEDYGLLSQLGVDGVFNIMESLGFSAEWASDFTEQVGNMNNGLSLLELMRCGINDDEAAIAANSLKMLLSQANSIAANLFKTNILQASMGVVAFIDYAIQKFGTEAWEGRMDLYRKAYRLYYDKQKGGEITGKSHYRSAKDWYELFYPIFTERCLTEPQLTALIDAMVRDYCYEYWEEDESVRALCMSEASSMGFTYTGGFKEEWKQQFADEMRGDLYNGVLVSVFTTIKKHMTNSCEETCSRQQRQYLRMMNTKIYLKFTDSSCDGKTPSAFKDCKVRIDGLPAEIADPQNWECTLNEKGEGWIGFTTFAYLSARLSGKATLIGRDDIALQEFTFTIPRDNGSGRTDITIDLATQGITVADPPLPHLTLTFDEPKVATPTAINGYAIDFNLITGEPIEKPYSATIDAFTLLTDRTYIKAIERYFRQNNEISISGSEVLIGSAIRGKYDAVSGEGEGSFVLDVTDNFAPKTQEQYVALWENDDADLYEKMFPVLSGSIHHYIKCTFTLRYAGTGVYTFNVTGEGTYTFDYTYVDTADGFNLSDLAGPQRGISVVSTTPGQVSGDVRLEYAGKLIKEK